MTNEEKTDILVSDYYINESDSPEGAQGVRYGAEMMAEWKDQQFKEIIAQVRKWLDEQGKLDKLDLVEFDMEMDKLGRTDYGKCNNV